MTQEKDSQKPEDKIKTENPENPISEGENMHREYELMKAYVEARGLDIPETGKDAPGDDQNIFLGWNKYNDVDLRKLTKRAWGKDGDPELRVILEKFIANPKGGEVTPEMFDDLLCDP